MFDNITNTIQAVGLLRFKEDRQCDWKKETKSESESSLNRRKDAGATCGEGRAVLLFRIPYCCSIGLCWALQLTYSAVTVKYVRYVERHGDKQ